MKNKVKKKTLIIITILALIVCALLVYCFFALKGSGEKSTAVIKVNGETVRKIELSSAADETFEIKSEYGSNIISIRNGEIFVTEASCPDKICIQHGALRSELLPIVCLPNKMVIELE